MINITEKLELIIIFFGIFIFSIGIYFTIFFFRHVNVLSLVLAIILMALGFFTILFPVMSLKQNDEIDAQNLNMFELNENNISVFNEESDSIDVFKRAYQEINT